jgi:predicted ATPase
MAITSLIAENFKGIADRTEIPIRPITLFIGANSSGKSTCIHGLA